MKGSAIIAAFILIVIGSLIVGGYLSYISRESMMTKKLNDSIKALYIAEAGLEKGISILTLEMDPDRDGDMDWFDGNIYGNPAAGINTETFVPIDYDPGGEGYSASFGEGQFLVMIMKVSDSKVTLKSTGSVREETRIIREDVFRPSIFDWAVFGNDSVHLSSNALIDSHNSTQGPYDPNNPGSNGDTGTNAIGPGVISLDSNSKIDGDAVVGPEGNPDTDITLKSNSEITGKKAAADSETGLPQITAPTDIPSEFRGHIALDGNDSLTIGGDSNSGQYEYIELNSNSVLTINGDIKIQVNGNFTMNSNTRIEITDNVEVILYITDALSLNSNSRINLGDGTEVTIYVDGSFSMDSNTTINNPSNDSTAMTLYGTDSLTNVSFNSNVGYYGSVYTRMADFTINSNAQIYGSLVAKSVTLNSNAEVHYDEALAGTGPCEEMLKVRAWREVYE